MAWIAVFNNLEGSLRHFSDCAQKVWLHKDFKKLSINLNVYNTEPTMEAVASMCEDFTAGAVAAGANIHFTAEQAEVHEGNSNATNTIESVPPAAMVSG